MVVGVVRDNKDPVEKDWNSAWKHLGHILLLADAGIGAGGSGGTAGAACHELFGQPGSSTVFQWSCIWVEDERPECVQTRHIVVRHQSCARQREGPDMEI